MHGQSLSGLDYKEELYNPTVDDVTGNATKQSGLARCWNAAAYIQDIEQQRRR